MTEKTIIKHKQPVEQDKKVDKKPCLTVLEGLYVGEVFELNEPVVVIGRDRETQITIIEDGVSRQHARIEVQPTQVSLIDLGSTNGTMVNGTVVSAKCVLRDGDKIRMGDILLKFSYQDEIDVHHHESMREMAMKDPLTQIYNRRYFMDLFNREINYAIRHQQPLCCVLFDLDHFKKTNDTFGHQAGDYVLKKVASTVSNALRVYDAFARYGGEEFVIMLRTTTLDQALMISDRLRSEIQNMEIIFDDKVIPTTISVGVAELKLSEMMTKDELLQIADENLYKAKGKGRNCVVSS